MIAPKQTTMTVAPQVKNKAMITGFDIVYRGYDYVSNYVLLMVALMTDFPLRPLNA